MNWKVLHADCIEAMREMEPDSVDAIVTDPPYGLEFMGKEWDRLDAGLPQEAVWKGRRGKGGSNIGTDDSKPSSRHHVALGMGKRHQFKRCLRCGKRQFSGSPCECDEPEWTIETPPGTPSSSIRAQRWHQAWATEALRVLKPGGHLLAFGGTRTYHRLACAVEDAGFEIRDSLIWLYGSGFPKSLDVSKAIDKAAGNTISPLPATPEAQKWNGWGTALKPAHEPIVVARKPLIGTVASNVLAHGTGALNIDGCRIGLSEGETGASVYSGPTGPGFSMDGERALGAVEVTGNDAGRWPANCVLSHLPECEQVGTRKVKPSQITKPYGRANQGGFSGPMPFEASTVDHADPDGTETVPAYNCAPGCPVAELDAQSGERTSGKMLASTERASRSMYGQGNGRPTDFDTYGDTGGASRFFYVAKASRAERNAGLEGFAASDGAAIRPKQKECRVCGSRAMRPGPRPSDEGPTCGHDDWIFVDDWTIESGEEGRAKGALRNAHPT